MIKYIFILLIGFLLPVTTGCTDTNLTHDIPLVPRPAHLVPGSGNYLFSDKTVFVVENEEQAAVAASLISRFTNAAGFTPKLVVGATEKGDVRFVTDASLKSEAYSLEVSPEEIIVKASGDKGFFYALQTIRQLLPASIERESLSDKKEKWSIPAMNVQDEPRFGFRGLLLDPVRCFIPKENVLMLCAMDAAGYAENVNLYTAGHALRSITRGSAAADELLSLLRLDPARYRFILAQSVGK